MISKTENIIEHILYLWQMENLIRAFEEDEGLRESPFLYDLYKMMHAEGVVESGHTQIAKNALQEAEEMHQHLLEENAQYRAATMQLQPSLVLLKSKTPDPNISDVEMMLCFLYNIMQLRLQRKEISEDTLRVQQQVSHLMAYLAASYKKMREEEQQ